VTLRRHLLCALAAMPAVACAPDPPCGLRVCDIREPDCQSMAAAAAACLRGVDPVAVPVKVVSRDEFIAQAAATPLTLEQEESFRRWNAGLAALGLAPADNTAAADNAASAAQLGGIYSFTAKEITIVDGGQSLASAPWVGLLVHENEHAIQDARFGLAELDANHAPDLDGALAFGAVFEGEATLVEDLADAGFFGLTANDIPWPSVFERWQASARDAARSSRLPVSLAWSHFRYPFGTAFVKGALDAGGWAGVDALFPMPPESTREVEAGFGAAEPAGGPWAVDLGDDAVPVLGDGYDYVGTDRLGAWLFEVFMKRLGDGYNYGTSDLPRLLRSDALSILQDRNTGGAVAVWRLRVPVDAAWFPLDAALRALPAARVDLAGDDVVVIAAADTDTLNAVPRGLLYRSVPSAASAAPPTAHLSWGCALRVPSR
jgi:hypothetical protein